MTGIIQVLVFKQGMKQMLKNSMQYEENTIIMVNAAKKCP